MKLSDIGNSSISASISRAKNKVLERLSSGSRNNNASDDAAGLSISADLESSARVLDQGTRNSGDVSSALSVADGSLQQIQGLLQRQGELAQQAANGTYTNEQRAALNSEAQSLGEEINRIASTTTFNGQQLITGNADLTAQVGGTSSADSRITVSGGNVSAASIDLTSQESARNSLTAIQTKSQEISSITGQLGGSQSRLEVAEKNNKVTSTELKAANSRIKDLDYAEATAELTRLNILDEGNAKLAKQAHNLNANNVAKLLGI